MIVRWISRILHRTPKDLQSVGIHAQHPSVALPERRHTSVRADNPIRSIEEDVLDRTMIARSFAEQILSLDASEGVVVGILGPWGSGKSSFVNLARLHLENLGVTVLDFNPWMFSGANQLVESFFIELSEQLKLRPSLSEIGRAIENYGEIFSGMGTLPMVGRWLEASGFVTKLLARILQRKKAGISALRAKVDKALAALDMQIVVILDDVDRLTTSEICDIFKLVRLTASFPNMIYVVAFDRVRVEAALTERDLPGRDYLEKILQISIDLPTVPEHILTRQILDAINEALSEIDRPGPFDEESWTDIFMDVIRPLFKNLRDVRRYAATVYGTVRDLNGQVALADVLALEAIRVFLPDVFRTMCQSIDGLTTTWGHSDNPRESSYLKGQVDRLIDAAGDGAGEIVRSLIRRLFPAAERHIGGSTYGHDWKKEWLRERRVAHRDILSFYFERLVNDGLRAFTDAEQAFSRMANRDEFFSYLRTLDPMRLQDVIASLETFEERFSPEHVVPGTVGVLNLLPDLPDRPRGLFDFEARIVVRRVVYRLVRLLKDSDKIEAAISEILPELTTLTAKAELITVVGHRQGAGHKLVSDAAARKLEADWRNEVRSAKVESLAKENELLRILLLAKQTADPTEPHLEIADSPSMTAALIRSARTEVRSQSMGSRVIRRSDHLAWDGLIELYGDENRLCEQIKKLKDTMPVGMYELIQLADKYCDGWRPDDLEDN
ncbi:MAG: NTPase KAP [Caldilineaceae bacterium]|nr:NTPase KAP [Caldilineaceae bacterium]